MLPHQTQIKICPYISLGINSHSQIAPVKIKAKKTHPSRPRHMGNAFLSTVPGRPPLCTPKTSAWPPPTCPAAARDWLSCSPSRECRGVGLPVGTRGLPRLGGRDLQPRGSRFQRWGVETWEEPQLRPHGSWNGKKSQQRPHWTSGEKNTIPSHQALWLLTLLARSHETTLGRPRRWLRLGWSAISNIVKRLPK